MNQREMNMPIEYMIFPEKRLLLERFHGRVTAAELEQTTREIWADETYDISFDGIVDLTDAELDMRRSDILAFCEMLFSTPEASTGRFAIMVSKPVETALSFLFQSDIAVKNEVAVFSTWASVRDFLDLPDAVATQLVRKSA